MSAAPPSGGLRLFTCIVGWASAFLLFPLLDAEWTASVVAQVGAAYRPADTRTLRLIWQVLLVLLIYAAVRTALQLVFAGVSLSLAALLFLRRRRDRHEDL